MPLALLCLAVLASCTGARGPASFESRTTDLFESSYDKIAQRYVEPVTVDQVALAGFSGLSSIDPTVSVTRTGNTVKVNTRTTVTSYNAPANMDARGWAALTTSVVNTGRAHSDRLQNTSDDAVYQALFDSVTKVLDSNTRYLPPNRAKDERARRIGFGGIGIQLHAVDGGAEVLSVVPETPAAAAGIRPRDRLVRIDGKLILGMDIQEVVDRVRGPIGTNVDLEFQREGLAAPLTHRFARQKIVTQTVYAKAEGRHLEIKIGPQFNENTAKTVQAQVAETRRRMGPALSGIVIDLRDNGGGLLDQAERTADLFLRKGIIGSTRGRHKESMQNFVAKSDDDVSGGLPIVVLVNGASASAAEFLAAALQDNGRAVIVGTGTYGKGTVQLINDLPNNGELMVTWSRLYAPSGYSIHRLGVPPTICTSGGIETVARAIEGVRVRATEIEAHLARWQAQVFTDTDTINRLRNTCPPEKVVRAVDLEIARALLDDVSAYRQAVGLTRSQIARQD